MPVMPPGAGNQWNNSPTLWKMVFSNTFFHVATAAHAAAGSAGVTATTAPTSDRSTADSPGNLMPGSGRPLPPADVGYPVAQLGGQLCGGEIARPTGSGRPGPTGCGPVREVCNEEVADAGTPSVLLPAVGAKMPAVEQRQAARGQPIAVCRHLPSLPGSGYEHDGHLSPRSTEILRRRADQQPRLRDQQRNRSRADPQGSGASPPAGLLLAGVRPKPAAAADGAYFAALRDRIGSRTAK